jgi:hypothetical protein
LESEQLKRYLIRTKTLAVGVITEDVRKHEPATNPRHVTTLRYANGYWEAIDDEHLPQIFSH